MKRHEDPYRLASRIEVLEKQCRRREVLLSCIDYEAEPEQWNSMHHLLWDARFALMDAQLRFSAEVDYHLWRWTHD